MNVTKKGNSMSYTLGEAAKATGKSKTTIFRSIKSGKISATKNNFGKYDIDPAELHRVYTPISKEQNVTPQNNELLQQQITFLEDQINDYKLRLDRSEQERRDTQEKLTLMLTNQNKKGLIARIFS